mmetsp:Transcript_87649/g.281299  ORF Transcript_87649/g.281299 Transcript_87649/m.281299 type:complete len:273 (-) Transcript_87649:589-1407(-)
MRRHDRKMTNHSGVGRASRGAAHVNTTHDHLRPAGHNSDCRTWKAVPRRRKTRYVAASAATTQGHAVRSSDGFTAKTRPASPAPIRTRSCLRMDSSRKTRGRVPSASGLRPSGPSAPAGWPKSGTSSSRRTIRRASGGGGRSGPDTPLPPRPSEKARAAAAAAQGRQSRTLDSRTTTKRLAGCPLPPLSSTSARVLHGTADAAEGSSAPRKAKPRDRSSASTASGPRPFDNSGLLAGLLGISTRAAANAAGEVNNVLLPTASCSSTCASRAA